MENVIRVNLCGTHNKLTQALYQYDYGQVLLVEGISLPETYEVHFANERDGETVTVIGTSEGVQIPDTLLETGKDITAYIYLHEAETDGETEYVIRIPVHNRPRPADFEPTEEEEITIASLLAAMNNAIEHASQSAQDAAESAEAAEETIGSYEEMTAAATDLPHGSQPTSVIDRSGDHPVLRLGIPEGGQGDPGYSPVVEVTDITGGHRVTITDADGEHIFYVTDGAPGEPGDDGFSPTVTVTNITGGHRVTITDAEGDHTFDVMDGQGGSGGAVSSVNGETGDVVLDGRKINVNNSEQTPTTIKDALDSYNRALNDKYEKPTTGIPASDLASGVIPTVPVQDVQIDGTSILQNGVANVPYMSGSAPGVAKINYLFGVGMMNDGQTLGTSPADSNQVHLGAETRRPIVPNKQNESVFYGLAKAAGADMKNIASTTIGVYPEAQKSAIQKMFGVYQRGEVIRSYTTAEDLVSVTVDTDEASQSFELSKVKVIVELPATTTGENSNFLADALTINELTGNDDTYRFPTLQAQASLSKQYFFYEFETYGGYLTYSRGYRSATYNTSINNIATYASDKSPKCVTGFRIQQYSSQTSLVPAGTKIMIYGVRA